MSITRKEYEDDTQALLLKAGFDVHSGWPYVMSFQALVDCMIVTVTAHEGEDGAYALSDEEDSILVKDIEVKFVEVPGTDGEIL